MAKTKETWEIPKIPDIPAPTSDEELAPDNAKRFTHASDRARLKDELDAPLPDDPVPVFIQSEYFIKIKGTKTGSPGSLPATAYQAVIRAPDATAAVKHLSEIYDIQELLAINKL